MHADLRPVRFLRYLAALCLNPRLATQHDSVDVIRGKSKLLLPLSPSAGILSPHEHTTTVSDESLGRAVNQHREVPTLSLKNANCQSMGIGKSIVLSYHDVGAASTPHMLIRATQMEGSCNSSIMP